MLPPNRWGTSAVNHRNTLNKEGQHQSGAAKNGPDDAPFALFQQPDAAILKNADPVFDILFELF